MGAAAAAEFDDGVGICDGGDEVAGSFAGIEDEDPNFTEIEKPNGALDSKRRGDGGWCYRRLWGLWCRWR